MSSKSRFGRKGKGMGEQYVDPALIMKSLITRYGQQGVSFWTAYLSEISRLFITAVSKLSDHQGEVVCPDEIAIVMRFPSDHPDGHCGLVGASLNGFPQDEGQKEALLVRTLECLRENGDLFPQVPPKPAEEKPVEPKPEVPQVETVIAQGVETAT